MSYPDRCYSIDSSFVPFGGIRSTTSIGGITVTVNDVVNNGGVFNLIYKALTEFEKEEFIADYNQNYLNQFAFQWTMDNPPTNHLVYYEREPFADRRSDSLKWNIIVNLEKVFA